MQKKSREEEEEVFRLTPELNKYYETALLTRKEGKYPNENIIQRIHGDMLVSLLYK